MKFQPKIKYYLLNYNIHNSNYINYTKREINYYKNSVVK